MGFLDDYLGMSQQQSLEDQIDKNLEEVLTAIEKQHGLGQEELRALFGSTYKVDEMALWFSSTKLAHYFLTSVISREGFSAFNSARDDVLTSPIPSGYRVQYWFINTPTEQYRIEAMCVMDGFSPYHNWIAAASGDESHCVTAHASFKVKSEEEYANVVRTMTSAGYEVLQHCTSSYGRFSYFSLKDNLQKPVLKVRINLRDAA